MNRYSLYPIFLLVMVLMLGGHLAAQQPYDEYTLEDSVTVTAEKDGKMATYNSITTKLPIPIRYTPVSVSVVTNSVFNAQGGVVLSDAVQNVSGVSAQSGNGVHDYFIIRGFNSLDNSMIMTDGTLEPEVTTYNLYNIERVEVLKGPGAFLYGGNPLSGTINLVRKQPLFDSFARGAFSYGSFNAMRATVDAGFHRQEDGLAFRLNGLYQQSDYYRDDKKNDALGVNPAFTWRPNKRSVLHADYEYAQNNYQPDAGIPLLFGDPSAPPVIPEVDGTISYQTPFDFSEQTVNRFKLHFSTQASSNLTIRNKFYFTDLDWASQGTLINGAFPLQQDPRIQVVARSLTQLQDKQTLFGNQLEAILKFKTGSIRHQVLAGVELRRLADDYTLSAIPPDGSLPFPGGIPAVTLNDPQETVTEALIDNFPALGPPFDGAVDAQSTEYAPYFVDQISFTKQVQVFIGGRYDMIDYEDALDASNTRDYQKFSPIAGLVVAPRPESAAYLSFGRAFAAPSTTVIGERDAEESTQLEGGIKNRFLDGKLNVNVAAYTLKKENIALPQGNGLSFAADQQSRGFELEIIAEPVKELVAMASYSYTDAELQDYQQSIPAGNTIVDVDYSGNRPAFIPEHMFSLWLVKQFDNGLGVSAGVRTLGSHYIYEDNSFSLDGYTTVNGSLFFRHSKFTWRVSLANITDQTYYLRGFQNTSVTPANPFTTVATMEINL